MTTEQKIKVEGLIEEFSKDVDVLDFVNKTESGIKITKGNYGKYMAFLNSYVNDPTALYIISQALVRAGADSYGVSSALGLLTGEAFR